MDNIISVGATTKNGDKAQFSNFGPQSVDVFAPGVDLRMPVAGRQGSHRWECHALSIVILSHENVLFYKFGVSFDRSTKKSVFYCVNAFLCFCWIAPAGGYTFGSGTSFAAPHVTAALAVIMSKFPNLSYKELRFALLRTCKVKHSLKGL